MTEASVFYTFSEAFLDDAFRANAVDYDEDRQDAIFLGNLVPEKPERYERASGQKAYDFIGTTDGCSLLISERVVAGLREHEISGWSTYPLELRKGPFAAGSPMNGYRGLVITGRCGPLDRGRYETVIKPNASGKQMMKWARGLYFDEKTWDGSDLFVPAGTLMVLGTEKAKRMLATLEARNLTITRVTEVERLLGPA